jgi:hypothetical protein
MTTRLKIDLSQGILEVEGSETFVKAIYSDFKAHFVEPNGQEKVESPLTAKPKRVRTPKSRRPRAETTPLPIVSLAAEAPVMPAQDTAPPAPEPAAQLAAPEPDVPAPPPLPTYTFMEDLKLGAAAGRPSLVEFMDAKLPITNEERNVVFLYYLQHILKVKPITLDHVFTCYRQAKIRAPLNIENSLRMTAEHRGWIKANQNGSMTVTSDGKQYVEKQLPKKVKN